MTMATNDRNASTFDFRRADHGRGADESLLWKLRRPLVPVAKHAIRRYGAATSARRVLPDYLLIGAKRGGSTTLARSLVASAGVQPLFPRREALKGTYFFDVNYQRGSAWYRSHFPTRDALGAGIVGDASPYYLSHPHASRRAHEMVPNAKIICVLRDPVDRAFSHYRERVKQGIETLPTFEAALDAEPDRLAGEYQRMIDDPTYVSWNHLNFAYTDQSRYGASVQRWLTHWPREQVLAVRSEDLYANPHQILDRTRRFLGLSPLEQPVETDLHANRLPSATVSPRTRRRLWAELTPDVQRLASLLDEPVWWSKEALPSEIEARSSDDG